MGKRVFSEEELERRREYARLYRAEKRQNAEWRAKEARRKKVYIFITYKKTFAP
jgi:hypothetical protein